ncbi:ATP-binding cassette sub- B member 7, mitochondrial [Perkinsus olseni]|uniref:ATP-binding cassette sub- B member 7, mitochondrial n=1 Tax=Perkinsus olseni TaxID=32597 RepID=A0A7J6PG86_PEROL|nr:ATP-binding cassette sub- B member 7, mitochondrial [Perkinsus olseni]
MELSGLSVKDSGDSPRVGLENLEAPKMQGFSQCSALEFERPKPVRNGAAAYHRTQNAKENIRVLKSLGRLNFGQQLIYNSGLFATLFLALNQCVAGTLPVGDLVMINTLLMQLSSPLNMIGMVYRETTMSLVLKGGEVSIKDLTFDYGSESRKILNGFSLDIPAGHRVAIVGSSGAGKSTVLRLLLRLYAPSSGSITIDGQPIDEVTLSSLRKNIGVVPQDCSLFHDTVFNNILYGRLDATEEEVIAAAKMAEIHDTIMDFPKGYQTLVGERGLKLSGGERQRIGIARCILKNPELVLFDEATSALDSETEQNILKGFEQLTASRTSLIVAHRLSTVMNCDTICVLDEGKIAEKGSHKELMNIENGKYRQLWERQFLIDEAESLDDDEAAEIASVWLRSALVNAMRRMLLVRESPLPVFFLELLKRELPRMLSRVLFGALLAVAAFARRAEIQTCSG